MGEGEKVLPKAIFAWLGAALFFLYQYILRVAPGLVEPELRDAFTMTANDFATLGSYFLFVYAIAQIPCGVLVDKIGVKKVILGSLILCLGGNGLLIIGHGLWEAQLSRILMGLGSACAYVGCLKVASDHFPGALRGLLMGGALTIGLFGPLLSASPLIGLIEVTGWRYAFTALSAIGVVLWFVLLLLMPRGTVDKSAKLDMAEIKAGVVHVFKTRAVFAYAIMTACFYAPFSVIADLWGVSFLTNCFDMPRAEAADITMRTYVGAALSSLIVPWACEKYKSYNFAIVVSWFGMAVGLLALLYAGLPAFSLAVVLVFIGIVSSSEILCFGAASHYTTPQTSGTTLGVINTFSVVGGAGLMQLVGYLLDASWSGRLNANGLRVYSSENYVFALTSLVVFVILCGFFAYVLFRGGQKTPRREAF